MGSAEWEEWVEWSGEKGNAGCLSVCRRSVLVFREGWEL